MIDISLIEVSGFHGAILGMRNPFKNREASDTYRFTEAGVYNQCECAKRLTQRPLVSSGRSGSYPSIGPKDLELCQKLVRAGGDDDAKFMRMIHVQADVWAPLYWWKEFDTYKVATVANSESTMHTIHKREFNLNDFAHDYLDDMELHITWANQDYHDASFDCLRDIIGVLNALRKLYLQAVEEKVSDAKKIWYQIIQILPESYMQKRTIDLNYQTLRRIYFARRNHKLNEWHNFCDWIKDLPYAKELITYDPSNATVGGADASN